MPGEHPYLHRLHRYRYRGLVRTVRSERPRSHLEYLIGIRREFRDVLFGATLELPHVDECVVATMVECI